MKNKKLKEKEEEILLEYIRKFERKQNITFNYWLDNDMKETAIFGHYFLSISDIKYDIDKKIPKGLILQWYKWYNETTRKEEIKMRYKFYLLKFHKNINK